MTEKNRTERVPVSGQVVVVLNPRELIINRGRVHGVTLGMRFAVFDADPALTNVVDPETGEDLGPIKREAARVEATQVEERSCIAKTYRTYTSYSNMSGSLFSVARMLGEATKHTETLKIQPGPSAEPFETRGMYVERGAAVVELPEEKRPLSDEGSR